MKRSLLSFFTVAIFSFFFQVTEAFAVKHVVNVQNYSFVPANLNVQVGDTIRWVWVNGTHTTTSTTIPVGASSWDAPITSSNQVYEYRVTVAGVYNYLCTPHSSSQIGSFTATAPPPPTLSVTPSNQNVTSAAGSTNFTVTSNSNWTATSNAGWCTVTPSGSGNGTLVANYQDNTSTVARVATITVTVSGLPSTAVTVTQAGAAVVLEVSPANQNVTSMAGNTSFAITCNTGWTANSSNDWCLVTQSGNGNGTLIATYDENIDIEPRVATITVTANGNVTNIVTVTQSGAAAVLVVDPLNQNVTALAGSTSFNITSNTSWQVASDSPWVSTVTEGSGNETLEVSYEQNMSNVVRIASLTITASDMVQVVTITQEGAVAVEKINSIALKAYPNPGSGMIQVTSGLKAAKTTVTLTDLLGNRIMKFNTQNPSSFSFNTGNLPAGIYILGLEQNGRLNVMKLTVTR